MAVGDNYQMNFEYSIRSRPFITNLVYQETAENTNASPALALRTAWLAAMGPNFRAIFSADVVLDCIITRSIAPVQTMRDTFHFENTQGSGSADAIGGNLAMRISTRGTRHGRTNIGHQNWSGMPEVELVNGILGNAFMSNEVQAFIDLLIVPLQPTAPDGGGEFTLGHMSRSPITPGDPQQPWPGTFVTALTIGRDPIMKALRSRQSRHTNVPSP